MKVSRRSFLAGSAAAIGAAGLGVAEGHAAAEGTAATIPFDGPHQGGVVNATQGQTTFAALDAIASTRGELSSALQALSARARDLSQGTTVRLGEVDDPPTDSGTLGPKSAADRLMFTIGFGASLYDGGYGLRKPDGLSTMPAFPDDKLDPARSHGDVMLQIVAGTRDTVVHTLRELLRPVRDAFALRWTIDGFMGNRRNLFGFVDGTANPDSKTIWTPDGGTFQVVRVIRMHVEFWDRVGLREQETMIGRSRTTGAPLGGTREKQDPAYAQDPKGDRIALDAHIRLANPRKPQTEPQRILRRGFNYHRGFDEAGQLDQGLVFVAYNRDIENGFAKVQKRLAGEPMTDYITPVGGGYFYVPPGPAGPSDWIGSGLFT
jgi:deferrochelatase/peroxidase EfeB